MQVKPFLLIVRTRGISFPLLVYAETYEDACAKVEALYPNAEITNNTLL